MTHPKLARISNYCFVAKSHHRAEGSLGQLDLNDDLFNKIIHLLAGPKSKDVDHVLSRGKGRGKNYTDLR